MMERALMTPDELKSIPKGSFVVMKTGTHPMRARLRLFLDWGITFEEPYTVPERADRTVAYARRVDLEKNLRCRVKPKRRMLSVRGIRCRLAAVLPTLLQRGADPKRRRRTTQ